MQIAFNLIGQTVYAHQIDPKSKSQYFCPNCGQAVYLKLSSRAKPFFCHYRQCGKGNVIQQAKINESQQHKEVKKLLTQSLCRQGYQVENEVYLSTSNQFADVYVDEDPTYILEYQQSPLASSILGLRHKAYLRQNLICYWLLDSQYLQAGPERSWPRSALAYSPSYGYYWLGLNPQQQSLQIDWQLPLLYQSHHYFLKRLTLSLTSDWSIFLPHKLQDRGEIDQASRQMRYYDAKYRIADYQKTLLKHKASKNNLPFLRHLYSENLFLDQVPAWILTENWQTLIFQEPGWQVLTCFYLQGVLPKHGHAWARQDAVTCLQSLLDRYLLNFQAQPLISADRLLDFVVELEEVLIDYGHLQIINDQAFIVAEGNRRT